MVGSSPAGCTTFKLKIEPFSPFLPRESCFFRFKCYTVPGRRNAKVGRHDHYTGTQQKSVQKNEYTTGQNEAEEQGRSVLFPIRRKSSHETGGLSFFSDFLRKRGGMSLFLTHFQAEYDGRKKRCPEQPVRRGPDDRDRNIMQALPAHVSPGRTTASVCSTPNPVFYASTIFCSSLCCRSI